MNDPTNQTPSPKPQASAFDLAVSIILDEFEGGQFTPDAGGTIWGLTAEYDNIDPATLTRAQAIPIYRANYWPDRGDELPWPAAFLAFDEAVLNVGKHAAAVKLQIWLGGLHADGKIGRLTIERAISVCANADERFNFAQGVTFDRIQTSRGIAGMSNAERDSLPGHVNRYYRALGFALAYGS
jgi:lysozyme family protein